MKHVDLFSGIGGFALAVDWAYEGADHTFCEIDPFCQNILKRHWPKAQIHDDIKQFKADNLGRVDLLTGGFPCQPFSVAGEQRAQDDDRHLWPQMFRIIKECKPRWIIGENVTGIIELALEEVCLDLESEGYEVWSIVIPACAVNAPHKRDRVWIVAYANSYSKSDESINEKSTQRELGAVAYPNGKRGDDRLHSGEKRQTETPKIGGISQDKSERQGFELEFGETNSSRITPNSDINGLQGGEEKAKRQQRIECEKQFKRFCDYNDWQGLPQPGISRGDDWLSGRLDRVKSLGNAIVPQVAYEIIKKITL